jgi:hypothetical protein
LYPCRIYRPDWLGFIRAVTTNYSPEEDTTEGNEKTDDNSGPNICQTWYVWEERKDLTMLCQACR